ncbi:flagellar hook-associated protein FlgK [Paraburkholderia sp. C35]|uniref:flagellar hook-associated protein FlgK n=1 Tax=Paraburkholderia sp. C35 TaxID=2126993 RepID=UPI000D694B88|nr:flagellar hook-associated protein FlgK [Paraburkholderia sp. C35]
MSNSLLNVGLSGLNAAMWGMTTTGQNISNVNTPGYSRLRPVYQESASHYTSSGYLPQGVTTATIQRSYSQFLNTELNSAQAKSSSLTTYFALVAELNNLVGNPTGGIGSAITGYFTGLQEVANDPTSTATRQSAISKAQMLADQLHAAGEQYDQLRASTNTQIAGTVSDINAYAKQIAQFNAEIAKASAGGQPPNDLLDQRDLAVSRLTQLTGGQIVNSSDGVSVFMSGGQPLVVGSASYELGAVRSAADPTELSVAWLGRSGANPAPTPVDLADASIREGVLGGLLRYRRETLDPAQAELGAIAVSFAEQVNRQNAMGLDLNGRQGQNLFSFGNPTVYANAKNTGNGALSVTFGDAVKPPMGDYTLSFDGTTYALTDRATGNVVGTSNSLPATIGGLDFELTGAMAAGDSFTVLPARGALNSFGLAITDGSAIAAASPVQGSGATSNTGTAKISTGVSDPAFSVPATPTTLTFAATPAPGQLTGFPVGSTVTIDGKPPTTITITDPDTPVPYDPAKGASMTITSTDPGGMNAVTVQLTGKPADGDSFVIGRNDGATRDGSNAQAISNLLTGHAYHGGQTLTSAFGKYVNHIGNTANELKAAAVAQNATVNQISAAQQSVAGVNMNEEAANLKYYQQLYQANSKVIQAASEMFDTVLAILR